MDIGSLLFNRLRQNSVNETNDRRIIFCIHQIPHIGELIHQARQINIGRQVIRHLCRFVLSALVGNSQPLTKSSVI